MESKSRGYGPTTRNSDREESTIHYPNEFRAERSWNTPKTVAMLARPLGRILLSLIFIHAAYSKIFDFEMTVSWTHNTLDSNGFSLDKLLGLDDVGLIPMLVGVAMFLEGIGECEDETLLAGFSVVAANATLASCQLCKSCFVQDSWHDFP